jgi:AraC-like DNA-binding protein/ligand-binding sensor protein
MNKETNVMERLNRSEVFEEYQKAFGETTELPLTLRPLETWQLAHRHQAHENPFCAMMAQANRTCASCLEVQHSAVEGAKNAPATVTCFAGLCDTAVPIKLGERTIGFLQTGQVAVEGAPSEAQFSRITRQIVEWGSQIDAKQLREAYFTSKVLSRSQYTGVVSLLEIFGKHLSLVANQIALREAETESPLVRRARAYIAGHHEDPVNLDEIAKAMHVSTFYFCKVFKKATGLTFTDYLGRVRVEKAKTLLLNPHLRVSEIAYMVGFQSLTHFNRVFRSLTGDSPSDFRNKGSLRERGPAKPAKLGISQLNIARRKVCVGIAD